jgi:hypothetical protein
MTAAREFVEHEPVETKCYTMAQLYGLRLTILRYARSTPPGPARNEHRQVASSMRSLARDKRWLAIHIVDGIK